mgnify:CR=1 FL=1
MFFFYLVSLIVGLPVSSCRGLDRPALLKDLSNLIAQHGAHVLSVNSRNDPARGLAELRFTLKVRDFEQLGQLLSRVHAVAGGHEARRT